jgi:hypothetical protein
MTKTTNIPHWGKATNPVTGETAPEGYFWATNAMSGKWFLEKIGTPFGVSPASENYWSS